jgi:hypothetical protein
MELRVSVNRGRSIIPRKWVPSERQIICSICFLHLGFKTKQQCGDVLVLSLRQQQHVIPGAYCYGRLMNEACEFG